MTCPAALGLPQPSGPGVRDWLTADAGVEADAIGHLSEPASPGLRVVPAGAGGADRPPSRARVELLARTLAEHDTEVVVDLGVPNPSWQPLLARADTSLLVIRPCYLALRRATTLTWRPTGIVLVREPGRALGRREVEDVTGVRVLAEVEVEPSIARGGRRRPPGQPAASRPVPPAAGRGMTAPPNPTLVGDIHRRLLRGARRGSRRCGRAPRAGTGAAPAGG